MRTAQNLHQSVCVLLQSYPGCHRAPLKSPSWVEPSLRLRIVLSFFGLLIPQKCGRQLKSHRAPVSQSQDPAGPGSLVFLCLSLAPAASADTEIPPTLMPGNHRTYMVHLFLQGLAAPCVSAFEGASVSNLAFCPQEI